MSEKFDARMREWREQIDSCIGRMIDTSEYPAEFKEILNYACFPGGKRLRPILFLEWHDLFGPPGVNALNYACGLELLHCYSLIHDDMPCIDNDDMRRGKPSVHKEYGEGKALLAGDALLDMAYNVMFDASCYEKRCKPSVCFNLSGDKGIIHGQYLDLYGKCDTIEELIEIYRRKTASLISAACAMGYVFSQDYDFDDRINVMLGSIINNDRDGRLNLISGAYKFGEEFGVGFQIYDDLSEYIAGEKFDGTSIMRFLDLDSAKAMLNRFLNQAMSELDRGYAGDTSYLKELVEKFVIL